MSSFSAPWDVTQNISTHREFQDADNFAVTAVLRSHTWRRALHTCCTLASVIRARLTVFWCKSPYAATYAHTNRTWRRLGSWASPSLSLAVKWGREREGWGMCACKCVPVCLRVRVCMYVCRSKGSRWLSIVLQISWQSTSSWPVGDTRGLSGRCDRFKSFVAAPCCFCQKQAKLRFWTTAEAWGLLLNSHSAPHLNRQWCCFQTRLACIVVLSKVRVEQWESWTTSGWLLEEVLNWISDSSSLGVT